AEAVAALTAWEEAGAPRREAARGDGSYQHAEAIRIMDAWWPLLVSAQFQPGLGEGLYTELTRAVQVDETPFGDGGHKGSAYQYGWWSYVTRTSARCSGRRSRGRWASSTAAPATR